MGRTANDKTLNSATDNFDDTRLVEAGAAAQELAVFNAQLDTTVRAVALQIGYQLPADCTDPDLIQRDISANMRRSVEACLEVGRGLAVLKAACGHGNFMARLDVLGIDRKVSAKFMQAAGKFSNVSSTRHLTKALGNQTKLFEMLVLDDEQLEELELTGQTGELQLDKIATMSVKELRAALREAKADAAATDRVLEQKSSTITQLQKDLSREIDPQAVWSDAMRSLNLHVAGHRAAFLESITALDIIREKVMQQEAAPGEEAALAAAREQIGREMAEAIERAEALVSRVRRLFDCTLGALIG